MVTSNQNPFSMPPYASGSHQAPSIISSRMTDIGSEDGDDSNPKGAFTAFPALTGASSGIGLNDQNRPPSAKSSQTRPSTRPPPSRRGGAFGGPGGMMWNTSRPMSSTSRSSRSHVPSLASQAFFRPMSSQHLQARRNRPTEGGQLRTSIDGADEVDRNTKDHANRTTGVSPATGMSEFLDLDDESRMEDSPIGATTLRSNEDSQRPLQNRPLRYSIPTYAVLGRNNKQATGSSRKPKTSVLYQATIVRPTREMATMPNNLLGHERTYPEKYPESAQRGSKQDPPLIGANYQFFLGNTVFFWGGRLQNARDLPINIATGILAVLPSVLFLYYS